MCSKPQWMDRSSCQTVESNPACNGFQRCSATIAAECLHPANPHHFDRFHTHPISFLTYTCTTSQHSTTMLRQPLQHEGGALNLRKLHKELVSQKRKNFQIDGPKRPS